MHAWYGDRVQFVDVLIREAHPGEQRGTYRSYEQKATEARDYQRDEGIPWTVLVDDLEGHVHSTYGRMADPTYLIDADGRVAFYNMWTHPPTLQQALDELLAKDGRGVIAGGLDRMPHLLASTVGGWHGVSRGGTRALVEYSITPPGGAVMTYLGHVAKPALAPVALRAEPLPTGARVALAVGGAAALALIARAIAE